MASAPRGSNISLKQPSCSRSLESRPVTQTCIVQEVLPAGPPSPISPSHRNGTPKRVRRHLWGCSCWDHHHVVVSAMAVRFPWASESYLRGPSMFGIVTVQGYIYLSRFPRERWDIKLTVRRAFVLAIRSVLMRPFPEDPDSMVCLGCATQVAHISHTDLLQGVSRV